jgi:ribosome-binding factor A
MHWMADLDIPMTSSSNYKRADRVGDLIRTEISRILLRDVRDPRVRNLTITGVKMSSDLRTARIYFVPLGDGVSSDEVAEGLKRASNYLRRELAKTIRLRYVPEMIFTYDGSFEYGDRIDRLLASLHEEKVSDDQKDS